tara:strand:- start:49 stop:207 length:159 start_codon:yes stop_codon:yes gene_type:complete
MNKLKHVLNINQNISENDSIIVEDILKDTLLKLKKLKTIEKIYYQINVSYET